MKTSRLWLIVPIYLDVESFLILRERLLGLLARHLPLRGARLRFVVVDDTGGLDPEIHGLRDVPDVMVVEPPFNLGSQRAIVYGIRSVMPQIADTDIVITLDSDGEDRPEDLPRILAPLLDEPVDERRVSLAWRTRRRETLAFKGLYFLFKLLFRSLTGLSVRTGNYAAYRGWLARRILLHPYFDLCYSSTLVSMNLPVTFVPCERGTRYAGHSRMNYQKLFIHGLRMLMPFTDRIAIRALFAFSVTFAVGIALSLVLLAARVFGRAVIPGWAPTTVLLVLILSFVALGNFIVLFAVFSQSSGISLANLEYRNHGQAKTASAVATEKRPA